MSQPEKMPLPKRLTNRMALTRLAPRPIPVEKQPAMIAIMLVALATTASFVMPDGFLLVAVTGLAVAYRWRLLIPIQLAIVIYLISVSEFAVQSMPLVASGGVFFPSMLLLVLTAQWTAASTHKSSSNNSGWESLLYSAIFVAGLYVLTVLAFTIANALGPQRLYWALYPHGIRLVVLIFLLGGLFIGVRYAIGYYQLNTQDVRQSRMHIFHTAHQASRTEEWVLFRQRRARQVANSVSPIARNQDLSRR